MMEKCICMTALAAMLMVLLAEGPLVPPAVYSANTGTAAGHMGNVLPPQAPLLDSTVSKSRRVLNENHCKFEPYPPCPEFIPNGVIVKGSGRIPGFENLPVLARYESQFAMLVNEEQIARLDLASRSVSTPQGTVPEAYFNDLTGVWQTAQKTIYVAHYSSFTTQDITWHDPATGKIVASMITFVDFSAVDERISIAQVEYPPGSPHTWRIKPPQAALAWVTAHSPPDAPTIYVDLEYWNGLPVWMVARAEKTRHDYYFDAQDGSLVYVHAYPETQSPEMLSSEVFTTPQEAVTANQVALPNRLSGTGTAFVVPVDDHPSWRDLNFLATIPAAARVNSGKPVVLTSDANSGDDPAVGQFLGLYSPTTTHRLEQGTLVGSNESEMAASLSDSFWDSSDIVVIVSNADYHNALPASAMASHLSSPILYVMSDSVPITTSDAISSLGATRAIVVGGCNSSVTTARPNGAPQGGATIAPYRFTSTPPEKADGATWELYGANGNFGWGGFPWLDGYGGWRPFYLAASTSGAAAYDRVMIDLNSDDQIENSEVFVEGDQFSIASRTYWVTDISGDGLWYQEGRSLTLELHTWKLGSITINGLNCDFVATSTGFMVDGIGAYDTVNIDLNENGDYGDPGEGPFHSGDVVNIGGKGYAISTLFCDSCWKTPGELKFTYPSHNELNTDLQVFYAAGNIQSESLAIVGYYDAVPFGITYAQPYADAEDIVTDKFYGDIDADPFVDLSVGRVVAETVHKASALTARSVTYEDLLDGDWELDSVIVTEGEGEHAAIANTLRHHFINVGLTNTNLSSGWNDAYLDDRSMFFHFNHGGPNGLQGGPYYGMNQTMGPLVAMSGGCMTAGLDLTEPRYSIALQFLDLGAIAYLGNTRPASNPIFTCEGIFWDGMVYRGLPVGQAHQRALNMKMIEGEVGGYTEHIPVHEATLYGDPAVRWHRPQSPQVAAANVSHFCVGDNLIEAQYHGPSTWWGETVPCTDGTKEMYAGPGIFFRNFFDDLLFLAEVAVPSQISSITQTTPLNPPVGWTGNYYTDQHQDGSSTALWLIKPMTYDMHSGDILDEADFITYTVATSTPVSISVEKSVTPTAQVEYGDEITYALVISGTPPGTQVGLYDPLTNTTFVRFVEKPPGVSHAGGVITGALMVTSTNQVTVSFVAEVDTPGTGGWTLTVTNRACVYFPGGTLGSCIWSDPVANLARNPDYDDLYESLQIVSTGWVQEHVDRANQILMKTVYTAADWEEFFTEYFSNNPVTDDLRNYLGYPVFWWFSDEAHVNLQLGLMAPLEVNIETIVSHHQADLGGALDADPNLRQTMFNSQRFLSDMVRVGIIDESAKTQIYNFYTQHIEAYPQLWKKPVTVDTVAQPYVATVRAQMYMNLGDALPLTSNRKDEIAQTIALTGTYLTIWAGHSVLVVDNNGLDESQLDVINTYLGEVPAALHNLRYISVNSLLGNEGDRYQWFVNTAGVNIFDIAVGGAIENGFPDDVDPKYADVFSLVLAHEVNHVVDAYFSNNDPTLADRKDDLIEAAGDFHMNYLRSMFEDGFFTTYPKEFFASIANQWFADSAHTLKLGLVRWENGYRGPINQFLFFAEVYAQGGDEVPFYTIDEQGTLTRAMVPVQRDGNNHINRLTMDNETYRFALDGDGNVIAVLTHAIHLPIVMRQY